MQQKKVETIRKEKRNEVIARWRRKIVVYACWIVFFAIGISLLSRLHYFQLSEVKVVGNDAILESEINDVVFTTARNRSSFFIQKDSLLFIPKKAIKNQLYLSYPRLKTIEISKDFPRSLTIDVTEHSSDIVWCKDIGSQCFFIDRDGVLIDESPYFSGDAYFRIYNDSFGGITGDILVSFEKLQNIQQFRELLQKQMFITTHSLVMKDEDTFAFRITAPLRSLNDSPELLVIQDFNPEATVLNILTIMSDPSFVASYSKHPEKLEYIDLRFGNKVYFKFKD